MYTCCAPHLSLTVAHLGILGLFLSVHFRGGLTVTVNGD